MTRGVRDTLAVVVLLLHVGLLVAPAGVLAAAADKGGIPDRDGRVLFGASLVVGLASGLLAAHRLREGGRTGRDPRGAVIAALDSVVVLALASTGLLFVTLGAYAPVAPLLVNRGWPVVFTWVLALVAAGILAELVRVGVARWLADGQHRAGRSPEPPPGTRERTPT